MADPENNEDTQNDEDIVTLNRGQIRSMERDAKEARTLKREMAFLKAGIDTTSGVGKLAFTSYDGDLTPESVTAFAEEYGITATAQPQAAEPASEPAPTEPKPSRYDAGEQALTALRRGMASGSAPSDDSEDPSSAAVRTGREIRKTGTLDDSLAAAISVKATAAKNGDGRALVREVHER